MAKNSISGYILLSMPSSDVQPLGLLSLQNKGVVNTTAVRIDDLFVDSSKALPLISKDTILSPGINKTLSWDIDVNSHISLLQGLLNYIKLSALFKLKKNKTVKVNLLDARKNNVNEFELDAFINAAKVNQASEAFVEMLEENKLYVITDILKCKNYSLEYSDEKGIEAGVEANATALGEGGITAVLGKTNIDNYTGQGENYITIALKAYQIHFEKNKENGKISCRIRNQAKFNTALDYGKFDGEILNGETLLNETINVGNSMILK